MKILYLLLLSLLFFACSEGNGSSKNIEGGEQKEIAREKEKLRLDSLAYYRSISDSLFERRKTRDALAYLDSALVYAKAEKGALHYDKASYLYLLRDYEVAAEQYQSAINEGFKKDTCHYQRALCFEKKRDRQLAVNELREAMKLGHDEAETLYERINPERKRVAYYVTRCCDGSTSSAKGRGACSHHGGVCNWNDPVYETYRSY